MLRLREKDQIFNTENHSPFLCQALDSDAEFYISNWAMDYPGKDFCIVVMLQEEPGESLATVQLALLHAIQDVFDYKAGVEKARLHRLLWRGSKSLVIAVFFLGACLAVANWLDKWSAFYDLGGESFRIFGWVGLWPPASIFLHEWWPILRTQKILEHLGQAEVQVHLSDLEDARGGVSIDIGDIVGDETLKNVTDGMPIVKVRAVEEQAPDAEAQMLLFPELSLELK